MKKIKIYPANKKYFIKLKEFAKEILELCKKIGVKPIAYGSLVFFGYAKDKKININDIDFLILENTFEKIIKALKKRKIKYNYSEEWHTLQVFNKDLKIEFDSMDFWQKDLPHDVEVFGKPRTLVRGTLRASQSPNKLRTKVRSKAQGLFDVEDFDFDGLIVKAVSLNSLRAIYKKASEVSKDNPHGNFKKYEVLKMLK